MLVFLLGAGGGRDAAASPDEPAGMTAFTYEQYCDTQGRFTYDGAALKLVKRPAHLAWVYKDAERGDARAKELMRELEHWFHQAGVVVADTTTRPACLPLPELTPECQPNWQFLTEFLGDTREAKRLRQVVAHAYEVRARERGVQNKVIAAGVSLLLAGGLAQESMTQAAAAKARGAAGQALTTEAKAAQAEARTAGLSEVAAKINPLEGITYTAKVRAQMRPNPKTGRPDNHGFPLEVDNSAGRGRQTTIKGGDGVSRTKVELDGYHNGQQGTFEWIIEPNGTVNHRLFVPKPGGSP